MQNAFAREGNRPLISPRHGLTPQISLHDIPDGYPGTLRTAGHIARLIKQGARDFQVRQTAIDILLQRGVKPKDYVGEIKALFDWTQQNIRYTKDTVRVEVLHSARRMLQLRAGDCDDFTILLGAMLEAIGHPVRLILIGPNPLRRGVFSHIYLEAFCKGRWIPLDATMSYAMGWAPRALLKKVIAIDRRANMTDDELRGIGAAAPVPEGPRDLIRAVRSEAIKPKDPRVKSLWDLLKQRQLLGRSPWLKAVLRQIWDKGLMARPRPITTRRMVESLRLWGVLPPARGGQADGPLVRGQAVRPVALKPVASARPVDTQPVRRAAGRGSR